jgi:hypothetical protein
LLAAQGRAKPGAKKGAAPADDSKPKSAAEALATELTELKAHRKALEDEVKGRLKEATKETDPKIIAALLEEATMFGDSLSNEVAAAKSQQDKLSSDAAGEMSKLMTSEDLEEVLATIEKHDDSSAPAEVQTALDELKRHRDELIGTTKAALLELAASSDPNKIKEEIVKYKGMGRSVKIEVNAVEARFDTLISDAKKMCALLIKAGRKPAPTLEEVDAMLAKYAEYPAEEMKDALDSLRANRALMSSSIKDTLTLLLKSEDIVAIDDAIKKYAGTEGPLAETYKELEKRRETLQKEMEKKLTDAAKLETPMEITQVLEEGAKYGDSLETQIQALRDHQQQLLTDANSKLGELASSEDFAEVDAGVSKYEKWPQEVHEALTAAQKQRQELVDAAKAKLLELCGLSDPNAILEALPTYEAFGVSVEHELAAAKSRHKTLFANANDEMQKLAIKPDATVSEIEALIERYKEFPQDELQQSISLLRTVINNKANRANEQLLLLLQSDDVQEIDKVIKENDGSEAVADTLEKLRAHRGKLLDDVKAKLSDVSEINDPAELTKLIKEGQLFGEGEEGADSEVQSLIAKVLSLFAEAKAEISDKLSVDDANAVAEVILKYEQWPKTGLPADAADASIQMHTSLQGLRDRRDELVIKAKTNCLQLSTSDDLKAIIEAITSTASLDDQMSTERQALDTRRKQLVEQAKSEMITLASRTTTTVLDIEQALERFAEYPDDLQPERDSLKSKKVLVIAHTKDELLRLKDSDDIQAVEKALSDSWEGYGEALADTLKELEEHKQSLQSGIKDKLAQVDTIDDVLELGRLLDLSAAFEDTLQSERAALRDKQTKIFDEARQELVQLCKSEDFTEVSDALKKFEEYGGPTESAWNSLAMHLEELVDSVKLNFIELTRSEDAVAINAALAQYEMYGDEVVVEREALLQRRKVLYKKAVVEMQTFASRSDVSFKDVTDLLEKFSEYPEREVSAGRGALKVKLTQMSASVADRLSFLTTSKNIQEIDQALKESEGLGDGTEIATDREKLLEHRNSLKDNLSKRLADAVQLESPATMQLLVEEAEMYGEDLAAEVKELRRRRDILVATASNEMKTMLLSEDFRALAEMVQKYEGFAPETDDIWQSLKVKARRESGNAKTRLERLARSNDPNEIWDTMSTYEGAEKLLAVELAQAKERYEQLLDMARIDMKTLAKTAEPSIMDIEQMIYKYAKFPDAVDDARKLLNKKADEVGSELEAKLKATAHSEDIAEVTAALKKYADAGDRFIQPMAALRKQRQSLCDALSERMKEALSSDDPRKIEQLLKTSIDYEEDLRVEMTALAKRKRELLEQALTSMDKLLVSTDFPAISQAVEKYEDWGESTQSRWRQLKDHWVAQLDNVKKTLHQMCSESEPDKIDAVLKGLQGMEPKLLMRIESEMDAAQARRASLLEQATKAVRLICADNTVNVKTVEQAIAKYTAYPDIDASRAALDTALEESIDRARKEIVTLLATESVEELDAGLLKHTQESGEPLAELLEDVKDRRKYLLNKVLEQVEDVTATENVKAMSELLLRAEAFGVDASDHVSALQARRAEVVTRAQRTLQELSKSSNVGDIAEALERYNGFADETAVAYTALKDRHESLAEVAKSQLLLLASSEDPALIATGLATYESYGDDIETERAAALKQQTELVDHAKDEVAVLVDGPLAGLKDIENAMTKFAAYPDMADELETLANHRRTRVEAIQDELAILRNSDDIIRVNAALEEHKDSSSLVDPAVRDLEFHMVALGSRMRDRLGKLLMSKSLPDIDKAIAESQTYGIAVEQDRKLLLDQRRKILRVAAEDIAELCLSEDFEAIEAAIARYKTYPEETSTHVARLQEHRAGLVTSAQTVLSGLKDSSSLDEIDGALKLYEPLGDAVQEERSAAQRRKEELFGDARNEMDELSKRPDATIIEIEQLLAKYQDYPNGRDPSGNDGVRKSRDMLKTQLAVHVAKVRGEIRDVLQSTDMNAVQEKLSEYASSGSNQVAGVVADLRARQEFLVADFVRKLNNGLRSNDPREIDKLLAEAKAYEGMQGVKAGIKALSDRRSTVIRKVRQQIKAATRAKTFTEVCEAVAMYEEYPEDTKVEFDLLKAHKDQVLDVAKTSLKELAISDDPSFIAYEVSKYEEYGDQVGAELDEAIERKKELVATAVIALEELLQDSSVTMAVISTKLIDYAAYPDIDHIRIKLTTKLDALVAQGKKEVTNAMSSEDMSLVNEVLTKHESSGEHLDAPLRALEAHRDRLEVKLLRQLEDTLRLQDAGKVALVLADMEPLKENVAFSAMVTEVQQHYDGLRQGVVAKIEAVMASETPTDVSSLLERANDFENDEETRNKFDELRRHKAYMVDMARDKILSSQAEENPQSMAEALETSAMFADDLKQERTVLTERRTAVVDRVIAELRAVGMSDNFASVMAAIEKYTDFAVETSREWSQLQRRSETMVENAKMTLRSLCSSTDPVYIQQQIDLYDSYIGLVDGEKEAATARKSELMSTAKTELQELAQKGTADGGAVAIAQALQRYRSYPDDIEDDRKALDDLLRGVIREHDEDLRTALRSNDIAEVVATLRKCEASGMQEYLAAGLKDVARHRFQLEQEMGSKIQAALQSRVSSP